MGYPGKALEQPCPLQSFSLASWRQRAGLRWGALAFGLSSGYSHMVSSLIHPKGLFTYLAVDVGCYLGS